MEVLRDLYAAIQKLTVVEAIGKHHMSMVGLRSYITLLHPRKCMQAQCCIIRYYSVNVVLDMKLQFFQEEMVYLNPIIWDALCLEFRINGSFYSIFCNLKKRKVGQI